MFVLPTSSLINRRAFEAAGGFDERLIGYEDDDLFLRIFRCGYDNVYLNDALSKWRIFPGSASYSYHMARSRMIYLRKLLETFPPDRWRNSNVARDLLTPRFFKTLLVELRNAVRSGDTRAIRTAVDDLKVLVPFLPTRHRTLMQIALPLMAHRLPATVALEWSPTLSRRLARLVVG